MPYIYSTLTAGQDYTYFEPDNKTVEEKITIKGGANLPTRATDESGKNVMPDHAVTFVTDEQLAKLKTNQVFNLHVKNKFLLIVEDNKLLKKNEKPELDPADKSAQLTVKNLEEREEKLKKQVPDLVTKK